MTVWRLRALALGRLAFREVQTTCDFAFVNVARTNRDPESGDGVDGKATNLHEQAEIQSHVSRVLLTVARSRPFPIRNDVYYYIGKSHKRYEFRR